MEMKIGVIKGDGIGPEIVDEAMKVLDQTAKVYGHSISYTQLLMGGASIDVNGVPLTEETLSWQRTVTQSLWVPLAVMRRLLHGISSNHQNVRKRVCYSFERDLIFLQT